jgi:protoporphyrinogen oxidase
LWQLSTEKQIDYLISVVQAGEVLGKKEPQNYEEWILWKLGQKIATNYMLPYNKKIWGVQPEDMDIDWLHKIPRIDTREIVSSCLQQLSDRRKMPSHTGFYYPKLGGFQIIFDSIFQHVQKKVILNEGVKSLEYQGDSWLINGIYEAKNVVNTAPWTKLSSAFEEQESLKGAFDKLKFNSIVVSLWEQDYRHDWHWCYEPNPELEYHREFYIHNFAPHSASNGIYTETNIKRWPGKNAAWASSHEPTFEYINEAAYPVPVLGHSAAIETILNYYKPKKLFGLGRWGQWKYFNSDICIWEAMKFINSQFTS